MAHAVVPTRVYVQSSLTNGEMKISVTSLIIAVSSCWLPISEIFQQSLSYFSWPSNRVVLYVIRNVNKKKQISEGFLAVPFPFFLAWVSSSQVRNGAGPAISLPTIQTWEPITRRMYVAATMTTAPTSCRQERANMEFVTIRHSPDLCVNATTSFEAA